MPECLNCGSSVSMRYVRVFAPDGEETVRVCPSCPDKKRTPQGTVRDTRATRRNDDGGTVTHERTEATKSSR